LTDEQVTQLAVNFELIPPNEEEYTANSGSDGVEVSLPSENIPSAVPERIVDENLGLESQSRINVSQNSEEAPQDESDNETDEVKTSIEAFRELAGCDKKTAKGYIEV